MFDRCVSWQDKAGQQAIWKLPGRLFDVVLVCQEHDLSMISGKGPISRFPPR